jgi:hypothetical protein
LRFLLFVLKLDLGPFGNTENLKQKTHLPFALAVGFGIVAEVGLDVQHPAPIKAQPQTAQQHIALI